MARYKTYLQMNSYRCFFLSLVVFISSLISGCSQKRQQIEQSCAQSSSSYPYLSKKEHEKLCKCTADAYLNLNLSIYQSYLYCAEKVDAPEKAKEMYSY